MQGPLGLRCVARAELWVVNAEERRGVGCWRRAGHVCVCVCCGMKEVVSETGKVAC